MTRRITAVTISPSVPLSQALSGKFDFADLQAQADATFDDGTTGRVLSWYDDELRFTEGDFVGKTESEVADLFRARDLRYLRT